MPRSQPNFSRIFRNFMFQYVDPERFADLFCPTGLQFGFQLVDCAAKVSYSRLPIPIAPKCTCDRFGFCSRKASYKGCRLSGMSPAPCGADNQPDPVSRNLFKHWPMQYFAGKTGVVQLFSQMLCYIFRTAKRTTADKSDVCHDRPPL